MRKHLRDRVGKRATFTATVARHGSKRRYMNTGLATILLEDVEDSKSQLVCGHLWVVVTLQVERLRLLVGDVVAFDARIASYLKGYTFGHYDAYNPPRIDYRLDDLRHIRRVELERDERSA